jgi:6,7-dimethyl-8-ribityllumazine synthase
MDTGVPCIFCVLTCETDDQAMDRAGGSQGNRGYDAVVAAVDVVNTLRTI